MPRGDRTGPLGAGPRTGRGFGYCAGNQHSGYYAGGGRGRGFGRGVGSGMGPGYGRGYHRWWWDTAPISSAPASEFSRESVDSLKQEMLDLKAAMESLLQRFERLNQQEREEPEKK